MSRVGADRVIDHRAASEQPVRRVAPRACPDELVHLGELVKPRSMEVGEEDGLGVTGEEVVLGVAGWTIREGVEDAIDVEQQHRLCHGRTASAFPAGLASARGPGVTSESGSGYNVYRSGSI